ncbi:MAG: hypothetical protein DKM50_12995 [Candidatus Margulisiibacteriota bacterium]|nr:MAG: hypothetical protein A2X43_11205 [Candidatus Margulisbacteria bacterium GWD2_39_127]OGI02793.1 MAG: hypothetical protein A2X42_02030 [Candidatus Margulisbacteria bacterium GWF2_38_17]OGI09320.1 MAG: hypothetical protein A2X41_09345 [Candidatus Margulisbacteria bacterium GWE2_39_32]PZM77390.1 MAG: hypothetical protein DKM50_12995 [Candidatus Margulisiibacteriota bacterium]HAR63969.1 hypothetical protein [Candidatus Margulisiibacteriota bacterium]
MIKKVIFVVMLVIAFNINAYSEEKIKAKKVYVFSKNAQLLQEQSSKSKVLSDLTKGQELQVIEIKDMWIKVSYDSKTGWINKYLVSESMPSKEKADVESMKINLKKEARRRASAYSTAASTRGLVDGKSTTRSVNADLEAVMKMEDQKVSPNEVKNFIKEGKLDKSEANKNHHNH